MQEITQPLAELPDDPVGTVATVDFPLVLRGYDREAVDEYVRNTTQLVAELYATRSPEGAVRRALGRVGEQVTSILARAHETAEGITSQSRAEAEERLMRARAEAEELERDARALAEQLERDAEERAQERERAAELRVQELDSDVDRIWAERERIVSDVRRLAEDLGELASAAVTRFQAATTDEATAVAPAQASEDNETEPFAEDEFAALPGTGSEAEDDLGLPGEDQAAWQEVPAEFGEQPLVPMANEEETATEPFASEPEGLAAEPVIAAAKLRSEDRMDPVEPPTSVLPRRMRLIDLHHLGREHVIGCWQVDDILIDPGPASCLEVLLAALEEPPRALLLTHIHLDHAGAAGSLVRRWPNLEVYVHERGAPHLIDPARLIESARRLYGDDMERLWGEIVPLPEANLRVLRGGEQLFGGRFEVAYTPGHASHHVSYLHEGTAFVGDVGGVRIAPETLTIPPTPPPDIDLEAWQASIDQVLRWKPERLAITHFGENDDVGGQFADLAERLDSWAALVRTEDLETFVGVVESEIEHGSSPAHRAAYTQAAPPEQIYAGLERYWRKREGASASDDTTETNDMSGGLRGSAAEPSTHAGRAAQSGRWSPGSH